MKKETRSCEKIFFDNQDMLDHISGNEFIETANIRQAIYNIIPDISATCLDEIEKRVIAKRNDLTANHSK